MVEKEKISVIIPIYNTAEYLSRCLDSVLKNTYKNLEVICVNDGSTDDSTVIMKRYAAADSRIIAVNKVNSGVSAARNTGLDMATGSLIAFVDSDDWVHPQYFEALQLVQRKTSADIVVCRFKPTEEYKMEFPEIDLDSVEISSMSNDDAIKDGKLKRLVWGRLYKRSSISGLRFEHGLQWGEDTLFSISALECASNIVLVGSELYYYYQRETSAMRTVQHHNKLALVQCYLTYYEKAENNRQRHLYLIESIKQALALRYSEMFSSNDSERCECRALLEQCRRAMEESDVLSKKEMLMYNAFILGPILYRLFRIIDDPTLIYWEKSEKKKRNAKQ